MKYKHIIFMFVLVWISQFQTVSAYEVRVQPDISITNNYILDENLYLASLRTWFDATYDQDIVSISVNQSIGGTLFGDIILLGKDVFLNGESFDDVRIVADTVVVSGVVNKDLIIVARNVFITSEAIINGDTLILAQSVDAHGQFLGKSQITASRIDVRGSIVGSTTLTGSKISFMSGSKISSEISYFSPQRASIEEGAEIQMQPSFNQIESITQNDVVKRLFFAFVSFWAIIKLIATLFVIFMLTQLFRIFSQRIIDIARTPKIPLLATGILSVIAIPLLIVILFGTLVLIPVSVIVGAIFVIIIMLLPAMSAIITASFYQHYVQKQPRVQADFNMSALALILLTFVGFVPYIESVLIYALYVFTLGAIMRYVFEQVRRKKIVM